MTTLSGGPEHAATAAPAAMAATPNNVKVLMGSS
jgi:hypothetical protein